MDVTFLNLNLYAFFFYLKFLIFFMLILLYKFTFFNLFVPVLSFELKYNTCIQLHSCFISMPYICFLDF